ncbi:MAG: AEC family transporter [Clostridiales bacterium]|nr:AEC family transporter [Clostridiales bacterium]
MTQIYYVTLKIVVCFIVGVILKRTGVTDSRAERSISDVLIKAILPFMILSSSQYVFNYELVKGMIAVACYAGVSYLGLLGIMTIINKKTHETDADKRVMTTCLIFSNTSFIGIPLMQELYGDEGLLLAAVFNLVFNIFFYTFGVTIISGRKFRPRYIITDIVSTASIAAVILFVIPWRFGYPVTSTLNFIGDIAFPLALIVLGSNIADLDLKRIFSDSKTYVTVILKLVVLPALVFGIVFALSNFVTIRPVTRATIVLMTALPSTSLCMVYADKYNMSPSLCARIVTFSTLLMPLSALFWSWLVRTAL